MVSRDWSGSFCRNECGKKCHTAAESFRVPTLEIEGTWPNPCHFLRLSTESSACRGIQIESQLHLMKPARFFFKLIERHNQGTKPFCYFFCHRGFLLLADGGSLIIIHIANNTIPRPAWSTPALAIKQGHRNKLAGHRTQGCSFDSRKIMNPDMNVSNKIV